MRIGYWHREIVTKLSSCNRRMLLGMDMDDKFMNHLFLIDL